MQLQHNVHAIVPAMWPKCSEVEVEDGRITYKLAKGGAYDLIEAYAESPHIAFANCEEDTDFRDFLLKWGPLWLPETEPRVGWIVETISRYYAYRSFLRAVRRIVDACKGIQDQRESLVEFLTAAVNMVEAGSTREALKEFISLEVIRETSKGTRLSQSLDPVKWAESASLPELRKVLASCVEDWVRSPKGWGLRVEERGKGFEIKPSFELHSLWDAMRWMVFFDEWNHRPPVLCQECTTIFRPPNAHQRKFCSPECAHRATNRAWRRRDLHKQKVDRKRKGDTNVTHKTR